MDTKTRSVSTGARTEKATFACLGPEPHTGHDPVNVETLDFPGYTWEEEEYTPNSGGGRKDWKDFQHWRTSAGGLSSSRLPVFSTKWGSGPHTSKGWIGDPTFGHTIWGGGSFGTSAELFGAAGRLDSGLPAFHVRQADGGFVPPPPELDQLKQRSLDVMLPTVKEELSLLNSVYELKDFKRLPGTFRRIAAFGLSGAKASLKTLRQLLQLGAEGTLTWEFAVRPLISDISGIHAALSKVERRMNDLVTRSAKRQSKHFSWHLHEFDDVHDTYSQGSPAGYGFQQSIHPTVNRYGGTRDVIYEASHFHAQIEYNYNYTQYQREHALVLGLLDSFGINLNPAIIWNALPWTFVVDWLVGVNQWLDRTFKVQNMEPTINIHRYLWSIRRSRTIRVTRGISFTEQSQPTDPTRVYMPTVRQTSYRRVVGMPNMNSIESSGLTRKEVTLGAALVLAQRRRPTKR